MSSEFNMFAIAAYSWTYIGHDGEHILKLTSVSFWIYRYILRWSSTKLGI